MPVSAIKRYIKNMTHAARDAVLVGIVALPVFLVLLWTDAFDRFVLFSRAHESYELDELVTLMFVVGLAAIAFSVRRILDLRREVRRRVSAEREARRLARHDALTGLPNRRQFIEEFDSRAYCAGLGRRCALLIADLDRFKPINDLYGHRVGDEVLRVIADRMKEIVGDQGAVARLGGDEFGVILTVPENSDLPLRMARRVAHEIPKSINLASLSFNVGVSIGIAEFDPQSLGGAGIGGRERPVEVALRQADMAMYRAKQDQRRSYVFFDADMDANLRRRIQLESEIKQAVECGQFVPYYQPLVKLRTGKVVGYEVLSRWQHPTLGILLPAAFIPIAEDTGMIEQLSESVFRQAFRDARSWPEDTCISVNLSPRQFADSQIAQKILALLAEEGLSTGRLEVEITETAVLQRMDDAQRVLRSLRNLGVRIALDDFGTGYSGLHHLRELPIDTIKIDQSYVTRMLSDADDAKLVKAIIDLSTDLGLRTTAEGVETREVMEKLLAMGCDTGQGYLFGRPEPMPAHAFVKERNRASR